MNGDDVYSISEVQQGGTVSAPETDPTSTTSTFTGWYLENAETAFDFANTPITADTTLYAHFAAAPVYSYIGADGSEAETTDYTLVTSSEENVTWSGTMIASGNATINGKVTLTGDTNLILCDGAELTVDYEIMCIDVDSGDVDSDCKYSLNIFGQTKQSGKLTSCGISGKDINIYGGDITAVGLNHVIHAVNACNIVRGKVYAHGDSDGGYGIKAGNSITISGGEVTVGGDREAICSEEGTVTLGWTKPGDKIVLEKYGVVANRIVFDKAFIIYENGILATANNIAEKTLTPAYAVTFMDGKTLSAVGVPATGEATVTKPADPTKTGYTFEGWYLANAEDAFDFTTAITADTTLYARWTAIDYNITINENFTGGTVIPKVGGNEVTTAHYGDTVSLDIQPYENYELSSLTVTSGETAVTVTNNTFTMPAGNVSVNALFEIPPETAAIDWNVINQDTQAIFKAECFVEGEDEPIRINYGETPEDTGSVELPAGSDVNITIEFPDGSDDSKDYIFTAINTKTEQPVTFDHIERDSVNKSTYCHIASMPAATLVFEVFAGKILTVDLQYEATRGTVTCDHDSLINWYPMNYVDLSITPKTGYKLDKVEMYDPRYEKWCELTEEENGKYLLESNNYIYSDYVVPIRMTFAEKETQTYRVTGDGNHEGIDAETIKVTIAKAAINPTVTIADWTYGEAASEPVVTGNTGSGAVTFTYSADGTTFTADVPATVGTYTVKASVAATTNYEAGEATATFEIGKAELTVSGAAAESRNYNGLKAVKITEINLDGIVGNDDVFVYTTDITGTLAGAEPGTYTEVTLPNGLKLGGADKGKYTLTQPTQPVKTNVVIPCPCIR